MDHRHDGPTGLSLWFFLHPSHSSKIQIQVKSGSTDLKMWGNLCPFILVYPTIMGVHKLLPKQDRKYMGHDYLLLKELCAVLYGTRQCMQWMMLVIDNEVIFNLVNKNWKEYRLFSRVLWYGILGADWYVGHWWRSSPSLLSWWRTVRSFICHTLDDTMDADYNRIIKIIHN